jgi:fructose-specific component phosphotransferase system IIB-like protein
MKKFLSLLLVAGLFTASEAKAQSATLMPLVAGDSISTSSSLDTVSKVISATAGYSALGIQVVTTKVSGTVAGKAYLYSSLDGTNYVVTDSSSAFANPTTNTAFFTKVTTPYTYYKVQVRGADGAASTQVNIVRVYYVARRHD